MYDIHIILHVAIFLPWLSLFLSYLALILFDILAINPNSTDYVHKKYKRKLLQFEETCELITYLGHNMTRRYQEPKDRAIDFDFKLDQFMQLQTTKATNQAAFVAWRELFFVAQLS